MSEDLKLSLDNVKEYMNENKEVREIMEYQQELAKTFLDTEQGKSFLQPQMDSYFSKGLETWKSKTLPNLIEEEIVKRNPSETAEQKRIRELEEKINSQEKANFKMKLESIAQKELVEKGLPTDLIGFVSLETEEVMRASLNKLDETMKSYVDKAVANRLKEKGKTPKTSQSTGFDEKDMTREKLLQMTTKECNDFYNQNPKLFKELMSLK